MLFRKLLLPLAVLFLSSFGSASAQLGVYGMFNGQRFGGVTCPTFASPCAAGSGHVQDYGGTFGAFYDFRNIGKVRIGADARGDVLTSNKRADSSAGGPGIVRQYAVMGGIRGTFPTPIPWLHPYAEIAVGYTRNNANGVYTYTTLVNNSISPSTSGTSLSFNPSVYTSQPLVKGMVGLDVRVLPFIEIRAIELGLGEAFGSSTTVVNTTTTMSAGGSSTSSSVAATSPSTHGIQSIGAGLVFRLP